MYFRTTTFYNLAFAWCNDPISILFSLVYKIIIRVFALLICCLYIIIKILQVYNNLQCQKKVSNQFIIHSHLHSSLKVPDYKNIFFQKLMTSMINISCVGNCCIHTVALAGTIAGYHHNFSLATIVLKCSLISCLCIDVKMILYILRMVKWRKCSEH